MCFRSPKSLCRVSQGCRHKLHFCGGCSSWVNKRCSSIPGPLTPDLSFSCKRWTGQARPVDGRLMIEFTEGREKLDVVSSFCYLGDCLFSGVGCKLASITRCRVMGQIQWAPARPHLPLISRHPQMKSLQYMHQEHQAKSGPQPYLICNDLTMIQKMRGVTTNSIVAMVAPGKPGHKW